MKKKRTNAAEIWKKLDDVLVPQLRLTVIERAVYSHLVRHTHLEGTPRISFSVPWLARGTRVCVESARKAVRRLLSQGALRMIARGRAGHVVEIRLPADIIARLPDARAAERAALPAATNIERADFIKDKRLRRLIHAREAGLCFYCLRRIHSAMRCLDHVVPQSKFGTNSYRNVVSACVECNSLKGSRPAAQFLRQLHRERRLSSAELAARLRALDALAAGKLRPQFHGAGAPIRPQAGPRFDQAPRKSQILRRNASRRTSMVCHWVGKRFSE